MNWYELATEAEVEETLSKMYRSKWDSKQDYVGSLWDDGPTLQYIRPVNFEIAEQLWAEEEN